MGRNSVNMNTRKHIIWFCIVALMLSGKVVDLQAEVVADTASTTDINGTVTYSYGAPGEITVTFPTQLPTSRLTYNAVTIVAGSSSADVAFRGDYIAAGYRSVAFKIQGLTTVSVPVSLQLVLRSSVSGRVWRNSNVTASAVGGVLVANSVTFERSSGWTRNDTGDLDVLWQEDLRSVEVIGVRLAQPTREGMTYTISDFRLSGDVITPPSELTPVEQALSDAFDGKTSVSQLTDAEKSRDTDGDGMEDYVEVLSENDDEYANSIFAAEIVNITDEGILIRWPCVDLSRYTVMRATSLMSPFEDLAGATALQATFTGYMTHLDTSALGAGPYFYKIRREK